MKLIRSWNRFFFEEKPTEGIALFRIVWMGLIFIYFLMDINNVTDFYGPHAIISNQTTREAFPQLNPNLFNLFKPSYQITYGLLFIYGFSVFFSMIGLFTRGAMIIALVCMTSFHQRNIWMLSSFEVLLRTITILLICSPCGHTLSVDAYLGRFFVSFRQRRNWPAWALRLIQIQLSVVYLWTFIHKLNGDTWLDGTAIYYATRLEGLTNFSLPLLDSLVFIKMATWGTLLIELSLGVLIWFDKLRKPLIIVGILFHLSIEYFLSIPFFEFSMMLLLINFFTPAELKSFVDNLFRSFEQGIEESTLAAAFKVKILRAIRGSYETNN